jgi:small-conductance mechanosensitive channel
MTEAIRKSAPETEPPVLRRTSMVLGPEPHPAGSNENAVDGTRYAPQDWSDVLTSVQAAVRHVRDIEMRAHEQRQRLRELFAQVREHLQAARDRAEAAEAREQEVRSQADAAIRAAEERARAAEERARVAEGWLARVADVVREEFPNPCAAPFNDHPNRRAA